MMRPSAAISPLIAAWNNYLQTELSVNWQRDYVVSSSAASKGLGMGSAV